MRFQHTSLCFDTAGRPPGPRCDSAALGSAGRAAAQGGWQRASRSSAGTRAGTALRIRPLHLQLKICLTSLSPTPPETENVFGFAKLPAKFQIKSVLWLELSIEESKQEPSPPRSMALCSAVKMLALILRSTLWGHRDAPRCPQASQAQRRWGSTAGQMKTGEAALRHESPCQCLPRPLHAQSCLQRSLHPSHMKLHLIFLNKTC